MMNEVASGEQIRKQWVRLFFQFIYLSIRDSLLYRCLISWYINKKETDEKWDTLYMDHAVYILKSVFCISFTDKPNKK